MPNGKEFLSDLEFEHQLDERGDNQPELIRFIARQQFSTSKILFLHDKRIKSLEKQNKKMFSLVGGAGAIIGTAVISVINYFLGRQS